MIDEGSSVRVEVEGGERELVTLALEPASLQHRCPATAAVTDAGRAVVEVQPLRWGRHRVGAGVATATDPSGAWLACATVEPLTLRVRPASQQMTGGAGVGRPLGIQGDHLSTRRGEGTELAEVREYRPGDRLRRITWRISSRTDELHVVDALTERDTDVLLVLDSLRPAQELGLEPDSSLDVGARAVLALARHYLGFGDRLGVHDLGHRLPDLPLGSGPRQLVLLHELLAAANRTDRTDAVRQATLRPTRAPRPGTLVFLCSPLLADEVLAEVGRLRRLGVELVVVDTLPAALGQVGQHAQPAGGHGVQEAWMLRRLQREAVLERLRAAGIPVAAWRGPASLAAVLQAMEDSRHAPRMARR
ncbi:DUF58 domain-containing protein [Luteococcus peritonei]|uniref:DUF58 domain-containing protein n=1 Tax=Luteococcus peritonei TaxID=88874 RepID=A0ABW4RW81_9ACTN